MLARFLKKPTTAEVALETAALINSAADIAELARGNNLAAAAKIQTDRIQRSLVRSGVVIEADTREFLIAARRAFERLSKTSDNADFMRAKEPLKPAAAKIISSTRRATSDDPRIRHLPQADAMDELYYRFLMHKPDPNSLTAEITGMALSDEPMLPNPTNMPEGVIAGEYARKVKVTLDDAGDMMDQDTRHLLIKAHNVLARLSMSPSRLSAGSASNGPAGLQFTSQPNPAWRHDFQQSFRELREDALRVQDRMMANISTIVETGGGAAARAVSEPPKPH